MTPCNVLDGFRYSGNLLSGKAFGSGHINRTLKLTMDDGGCYILQNINHHVFPQPEQVMANIIAVTDHLRGKLREGQTVLEFLPARDGSYCYRDADGNYWRMYRFVDGLALDAPRSGEDLYQAGLAFGQFQQDLTDFPAKTLYETIPDFHNTPDRYRKFKAAVANDAFGRAKEVCHEIRWFLDREEAAGRLCRMFEEGLLPLRVTHNDTKLNNVLLHKDTGKALCVLDLDTVMPGLSAYDFGDGIRFGAAAAGEDATGNHLDMDRYHIFTEGFLAAAPNLTEREVKVLPLGAWTMTLEVGLRFLTDYLEGDRYFKTDYPGHNLLRAKNQLSLAADMETKLPL